MRKICLLLFALLSVFYADAEGIKSVTISVVPEKIYVNQRFRVEARLEILGNADPEHIRIAGMPDEHNAGVFIGQWELKDQVRTTDNASSMKLTRILLSAEAVATNALALSARPAAIVSMVSSFGFFSRSFTLRKAAPPLELEILPLPEPAPEGFSGAVGRFTLIGRVTPSNVFTGEVVKVSLTLSGDGEVNGVQSPTLVKPDANLFKIYAPREKTRSNGEISVEQEWIPLNRQAKTIGPASIVCFNPYEGRYQTLTAGPFELTFRADSELQAGKTIQVIEPEIEAPVPSSAVSALTDRIKQLAQDNLFELPVATQAKVAPSHQALSLQLIPAGAKVTLMERAGEWCRVMHLNRSGWVHLPKGEAADSKE